MITFGFNRHTVFECDVIDFKCWLVVCRLIEVIQSFLPNKVYSWIKYFTYARPHYFTFSSKCICEGLTLIILIYNWKTTTNSGQKRDPEAQPTRSVLKKGYYETAMRTTMLKCDFNKVASNLIEITLWYGCSPVNLLHIFRTSFPRNTIEGLRLVIITSWYKKSTSGM